MNRDISSCRRMVSVAILNIPPHATSGKRKEGITLSETEREVLRLSAQGYTMNDIADRLCKSVDTIKACKRNLFAKMGVKNIAEALFHATNYQMI